MVSALEKRLQRRGSMRGVPVRMLSTRCGFSLQMLAINFVSYTVSDPGPTSPPSASDYTAGVRTVNRLESAMSLAMAARSRRCLAWGVRLLRSELNALRQSVRCWGCEQIWSMRSRVASDSSDSKRASREAMNGL